MDSITQIRKTFDKGSIGVFADKLSVVFTATEDDWIYQSIADCLEYKDGSGFKSTLERLIEKSNSLAISVLPVGKFQLDFNLTSQYEPGMWHLPLREKKEHSLDAPGNPEMVVEVQKKFSSVFQNVDPDDDESMQSAVSEWVAYLNQSDQGIPKPINSISQWKNLRQLCVRFFRKKPFGFLDIRDPDADHIDGCAEFQLDSTQEITHVLGAELKDLFLDMVRFSETVDIEIGCNGDTTIVNLDFMV